MSQIDDRLEALEHIPTSRLKFGWSSQKVPGELLWSLLSGPGLIDIGPHGVVATVRIENYVRSMIPLVSFVRTKHYKLYRSMVPYA